VEGGQDRGAAADDGAAAVEIQVRTGAMEDAEEVRGVVEDDEVAVVAAIEVGEEGGEDGVAARDGQALLLQEGDDLVGAREARFPRVVIPEVAVVALTGGDRLGD